LPPATSATRKVAQQAHRGRPPQTAVQRGPCSTTIEKGPPRRLHTPSCRSWRRGRLTDSQGRFGSTFRHTRSDHDVENLGTQDIRKAKWASAQGPTRGVLLREDEGERRSKRTALKQHSAGMFLKTAIDEDDRCSHGGRAVGRGPRSTGDRRTFMVKEHEESRARGGRGAIGISHEAAKSSCLVEAGLRPPHPSVLARSPGPAAAWCGGSALRGSSSTKKDQGRCEGGWLRESTPTPIPELATG